MRSEGGERREERPGARSPSSFRHVEIETPRRFTVCTFRGNWKFYERCRRGVGNARLRSRCRSPSRITDSFQAALYDSLHFSSRDIDRSRLKSDRLAFKRAAGGESMRVYARTECITMHPRELASCRCRLEYATVSVCDRILYHSAHRGFREGDTPHDVSLGMNANFS